MEKPIIIEENNFEKARKKIRENSGEKIIFSGSTDELNRKVLEKENIYALLINLVGRKDRMKQRDSGFNEVLAKIAKKRNVVIEINLDEILESKSKEKAEIISRVKQNIELCRKNKVQMQFISKSKKDSKDLKSLGLVLGMPTWMTKQLNQKSF